jgi:hypothetical protein
MSINQNFVRLLIMFFKIPSKKSSKKEEEKIVGTNTSVIDQPVSNYTSSVLILLGGLPE